ncbi:MAG TPA: hypothetical protein PKC54_06315 [Ferruginibacter sp.]|nr:hypothetical protein [Ferruginibacter sp.]
MNSRNKILKTGLGFFLILAHYFSFSQDPTFKPNSGNFKITIPALSIANSTQTSPLPYYTFFIEPGNGRYIKITDHLDGDYITTPYYKSYSYKIPAGATSLLNIVGHYDTIKPPKGLMAYTTATDINAGNLSPQVELPAGKRIGFAYSDSSVVINDTMTQVITYKPDSIDNSIVVFYYNDNQGSDQSIFKAITSTSLKYPFFVSDGNTKTTQNVDAIRLSGEPLTVDLALNRNIPAFVRDYLNSVKDNFTNAIYFSMSPMANSNERNIFISMVSHNNLNMVGSLANLKAYIVKYNTSGIVDKDSIKSSLYIGQFASDPNGITTTPNCLSNIPGGIFEKPIKYQVLFHNDGPGSATTIKAAVLVPPGIQLPPYGLAASKKWIISSIVGRKKIDFVPKNSLDLSGPDTKKKNINTYEVKTEGENRIIIFTMNNINLSGTSNEKARKDIMLRHGTISFTLYTIKDPNDQEFVNRSMSCMYSDVQIIFYSSPRAGELVQGTPLWGSDLIRHKCGLAKPEQCTRLTKPYNSLDTR